MPICIHCSTPIESLYMRYGRDHIVLSPCTSDRCAPDAASTATPVLADEYLEHDLPIVIIDLILAKPKAYRHLLFNRSTIFAAPDPDLRSADVLPRGERGGKWGGWSWAELWTVAKRFLALSLVDAYIRWFYLCVQPVSSLSASTTAVDKGWLSGRLAALLQAHLPMQAGIFFPSLFTPRASYTTPDEWTSRDSAIHAVCSAAPLWTHKSIAALKGGQGEIMPTLVSYLNVLLVTLIEGGALQLCVGLLSWVVISRMLAGQQQGRSAPQEAIEAQSEDGATGTAAHSSSSGSLRNRNRSQPLTSQPASTPAPPPQQQPANVDPLLGCKALLLSQLSPLILLTFVLLWSTKFPHASGVAVSGARGLDRGWMVWTIRTFLASLNAGVAIATILPTPSSTDGRQKGKGKQKGKGRIWPPLILGAGWSVQAAVSLGLYTYLS